MFQHIDAQKILAIISNGSVGGERKIKDLHIRPSVGGASSLIPSTIGMQNFTMNKFHPSKISKWEYVKVDFKQQRAVKRALGDGNKSKQRLRLDEMASNELQRSNESAVWRKKKKRSSFMLNSSLLGAFKTLKWWFVSTKDST